MLGSALGRMPVAGAKGRTSFCLLSHLAGRIWGSHLTGPTVRWLERAGSSPSPWQALWMVSYPSLVAGCVCSSLEEGKRPLLEQRRHPPSCHQVPSVTVSPIFLRVRWEMMPLSLVLPAPFAHRTAEEPGSAQHLRSPWRCRWAFCLGNGSLASSVTQTLGPTAEA